MSGRIRTIKPELLEDAVTAGLSETAFRLFVGMILLADDYGVLRAEPAYLAGQIFWKVAPSKPIDEALGELTAKLVQVYDAGGQRYAFIAKWEKHQKVSHRGKRRLPEPPESLVNPSGESPEVLRPDLRPSTIDQGSSTKDLREAPPSREPGVSDSNGDWGLEPERESTAHPIADAETARKPVLARSGGSVQSEETDSPERNVEPARAIGATPREQDYQAAYETGAEEGLGRPFAMPEKQRGELHQAMAKHARDGDGRALRGDVVLDWIRWHAAEFCRWVLTRPADEQRFWSGFGPRGMLRWLNEIPVTDPMQTVDRRIRGPREPVAAGALFAAKGATRG